MKRRNTPAKIAILNMLQKAGTALSQDMIEEKVKGEMRFNLRFMSSGKLNVRFCRSGSQIPVSPYATKFVECKRFAFPKANTESSFQVSLIAT